MKSEWVQESLRLLREQKAGSKLETLRQLIQEGRDSGNPKNWTAEFFLERMKNCNRN